MDSDEGKGLENRTARAASGDRVEQNSVSVVSYCVKSWIYFWNTLFLPFLNVVGNRVKIGTGIAIIALFGILISGSVEMSTSGAPANYEQRSISAQNFSLLLTSDCEGSSSPLSKPFECCEDRQSVIGALLSTGPAYGRTYEPYICEIEPGVHHVNDKLSSNLQYQKTLDKCDKLCDQTASTSEASFKDEVNGGVLPKSSNINNFVSDINSGNKSGHNNIIQAISNNMNLLKNKFWSFQNLIVLCFMPELDIRIAFVLIMILGLSFPEIIASRLAATSSPWFDFPLLMYIIAYILLLFSLILKRTPRRESQSYLSAGLAYTCAILGILSFIISLLSSEFSCVLILTILLVLAAYWYTPDTTGQRRVRD